jgi:hypothetical protein
LLTGKSTEGTLVGRKQGMRAWYNNGGRGKRWREVLCCTWGRNRGDGRDDNPRNGKREGSKQLSILITA